MPERKLAPRALTATRKLPDLALFHSSLKGPALLEPALQLFYITQHKFLELIFIWQYSYSRKYEIVDIRQKKESKMQRSGILSSDYAPEARFIEDYDKLTEKLNAIRVLGGKIVLTSGSFDLAHIGHSRYLREARMRGDFLVVGVESDERIKDRKGPSRPIVPQDERIESLTHLRYVDLVTLKNKGDAEWLLIKTVRPDTLVISERTGYDKEKHAKMLEFCGEVVNLKSQAETSTSARLREMQIEVLDPAIVSLEATISKLKKLRGDSK